MDSPTTMPRWAWPGALGIAVAAAVVLRAMGRVWWCSLADWTPLSFDTWSPHNSQHLLDAYSFTHFQHGLAFFLLLAVPMFLVALVIPSLPAMRCSRRSHGTHPIDRPRMNSVACSVMRR